MHNNLTLREALTLYARHDSSTYAHAVPVLSSIVNPLACDIRAVLGSRGSSTLTQYNARYSESPSEENLPS